MGDYIVIVSNYMLILFKFYLNNKVQIISIIKIDKLFYSIIKVIRIISMQFKDNYIKIVTYG